MKSNNPEPKGRWNYSLFIEYFDCISIAAARMDNTQKLIFTPLNGLIRQIVIWHSMKLPESRVALSRQDLHSGVEVKLIGAWYLSVGAPQTGVGKNPVHNGNTTSKVLKVDITVYNQLKH